MGEGLNEDEEVGEEVKGHDQEAWEDLREGLHPDSLPISVSKSRVPGMARRTGVLGEKGTCVEGEKVLDSLPEYQDQPSPRDCGD